MQLFADAFILERTQGITTSSKPFATNKIETDRICFGNEYQMFLKNVLYHSELAGNKRGEEGVKDGEADSENILVGNKIFYLLVQL